MLGQDKGDLRLYPLALHFNATDMGHFNRINYFTHIAAMISCATGTPIWPTVKTDKVASELGTVLNASLSQIPTITNRRPRH